MLIEQETASIIRYILDNADGLTPYYENIPEDFMVPSVYFPAPELITDNETFNTYVIRFTWYIHFFHKTTNEAYQLAFRFVDMLRANKNLIPVVDEKGSFICENIRLKNPTLTIADDGAVLVELGWNSIRPYKREEVQKMQKLFLFKYVKGN